MSIQIIPAIGYIVGKDASFLKIGLREYVVTEKLAAFALSRLGTDPQNVPVFCLLFVRPVLYTFGVSSAKPNAHCDR